jgi:Asp-tRNA(Asn)/Glu-tRNA(Gln) amidotransferase A subunit family amidase
LVPNGPDPPKLAYRRSAFGDDRRRGTKGIRTAGGARAYVGFVPDEDDVAVERLLAAGALLLGKTNVAELGYGAVGHNPVFPTTRNPWALDRTSGGSSAGSVAAVSAGMAPIALGSDGGGSIRIPAALCSIVGFKPSMGRVPLYPGCRDERFPGFSGWESIEHIGPMTRTAPARTAAAIRGSCRRRVSDVSCSLRPGWGMSADEICKVIGLGRNIFSVWRIRNGVPTPI